MYLRMTIAKVKNFRPKTRTRMVYVSLLDGSLGFGITPLQRHHSVRLAFPAPV